MTTTANPRSTLHALKPLGQGTAEVESLLGYFCRLAVSHSISSSALSRLIAERVGWQLAEKYEWHKGNLSGIGEAALNWSGALSALTGIERLDRLTLLPWEDVIASSGLAAKHAHWCPECLAEDMAEGREPYFRLAWDIGSASVCPKHQIQLVHTCPDCGRPGIRHKASYVVPGWCTHCGAFLGKTDDYAQPATAEELWKARQVVLMLSAQANLASPPTRQPMQDAIQELVTRLDHGKSAAFARRIGLGKATVHNWLKDGGIPSLDAHLRIASQTGLTLPQLLQGDLESWEIPLAFEPIQLAMLFPENNKRGRPRELDWEAIKADLTAMSKHPCPISLSEAARRLDIDPRMLYLQANKEARILGERWTQYMQRRGEESLAKARPVIEAACREILADGKAISLREIEVRVPKEVLGSIRKVFDLINEAKETLGVS